jgi:hypothetical protein
MPDINALNDVKTETDIKPIKLSTSIGLMKE